MISSLNISDFTEEESFDEENIVDIRESGLKTFQEIDKFCKTDEIQVLKVSNNKIPTLERKFFQKFSTIKFLDISGNLISNINGLDLLPNLVLLDISKNQITSLNGIDSNTKLRRILASKNQIQEIRLENVMPYLVVLDLHKNCIEHLDFGHNFPSLKELYVGDCKLKSLDGINNFPLLKHFQGSNNEITVVNLINHPNLEDINLEGCLISSFLPFQGCQSLIHINLSNNPIDETGFNSIYPIKTIRSIKLNFSKIANANFIAKLFPNIEAVDISGCCIKDANGFADLLTKSKKLRLLDTRWNPVCKNLYADEDLSKGQKIYESNEQYDNEHPMKKHLRHIYRNKILSTNESLTILDGIKVDSNVLYSESSYFYEEEEKSEKIINQKVVEIKEKEDESVEKQYEEEESDKDAQITDNLADDEESLSISLIVPTYSTVGTQAESHSSQTIVEKTPESPKKSKLTQQEAAPSLEIEAIDDNTKEEFIKKLKIQNEHLESELNQYKKFNEELQSKLDAKVDVKEELQQLRESTEIKEKQIGSQIDSIESSYIKPHRQTQNTDKSQTYSKLLDALTQQNAILVHELRKMRHKTTKKYPTYKEVVEIVDFLLGGNSKMIHRMKERSRKKEEESKLMKLAKKLEEQNELMRFAISQQKTHVHHHNHSYRLNPISESSYQSREYEYDVPEVPKHKTNQQYVLKSSQKSIPSDFNPSIYEAVGDIEICERKIFGSFRQPLDSQYPVSLDPNCKESKLLLMWSQFAINYSISKVNVIKAANTEKFIEAEYRSKQLKLFLVPCEDPPLFFDGFFPKTIVAFRKFRSKPKISTFLVICYDDEEAIFSKKPPQPSDEPILRQRKVKSVNFVNGGCDTLLILDTKKIIPLYSLTVN
ncbi:Leucine Rich Repeat family protein [Trichomonas vaginalis G3]|uniref:Leucine Rich Repeat family protein n=1 Tax=Trichomonas vaginalis (strain ATCC PRA-98 / G3) TaxID=412133 RepID=A2EQW7_TRIV3|nr:uncharacterized protein TVAGG3_0693850 [Trichomonas vaginalis G3]EAY04941.1 Leucine Rich Repeat family protein [Trichomonas vaginalis G3]KAI5508775.1 axoneme assembly [Trichomonas vaginalis G3]|eukprot:XP_001317164.1 hypothetical protein [Trichomonas vaginalis G3]